MDPQFWINLQSRYGMYRVKFGKTREIRSRVQPLLAA
jgi:plasmid maintenance system antidote protein VapI